MAFGIEFHPSNAAIAYSMMDGGVGGVVAAKGVVSTRVEGGATFAREVWEEGT